MATNGTIGRRGLRGPWRPVWRLSACAAGGAVAAVAAAVLFLGIVDGEPVPWSLAVGFLYLVGVGAVVALIGLVPLRALDRRGRLTFPVVAAVFGAVGVAAAAYAVLLAEARLPTVVSAFVAVGAVGATGGSGLALAWERRRRDARR